MKVILKHFFLLLFTVILTKAEETEGGGCPVNNTFDFIIVGAGSAGSTIAYRLSEVNNIQILIVEAGAEPTRESYIPYSYSVFDRIPQTMKYDFLTVPQKHCCKNSKDKRAALVQGKSLGGTSSINSLVYTRGNKNDYDSWEQQGNPGWSSNSALKYFLKMEDYQIPHTKEEDPYHRTGGPVTISLPSFVTGYSNTFLEAGKELRYFETDVNGRHQKGCTFNPETVKKDLRWSNYRAYLEPAMKRSNVRVWKNAFVTKIILNSKKQATGILFEYQGMSCVANVTKEVIISAGALSSPKLLMLSGIGPQDVLRKFQIPVVYPLAGVGQNLIDHPFHNGITAFADIVSIPERQAFQNPEVTDSLFLPLSHENTAYINTSYGDEHWPDIEVIHHASLSLAYTIRYYQSLNPNLSDAEILQKATDDFMTQFNQTIFMGSLMNLDQFYSSNATEFLQLKDKLIIQVNTVLVHPKSRGYVSLSSGNPHDPPIIDPKYLEHPDDLEALIQGFNETIKLMKTTPYKRRGVKFYDFGEFFGCGSMNNPTREYLECMIRLFSGSGFHYVGTNKMAPESRNGVVDTQLRVYGVRGIRVADSSVIPVPITGHTNAPVTMVGEKAADIIKRAWNLKLN